MSKFGKQLQKYQLSGWAVFGSCVLIIVFLFVAGGLYSLAEDWDFLNGIYFTIVTLSTTGYGDKFPQTVGGKLLNVCLIFVSFCGFFVLIRLIISYMVDENLTRIVSAIRERRVALRKNSHEHGLALAPLARLVDNGDSPHSGATGAASVSASTDGADDVAVDEALEVLREAQMEMSKLNIATADGKGGAPKSEDDADVFGESLSRKVTVTVAYGLVYACWLVIWTVFYSTDSKEKKQFHTFWSGIRPETPVPLALGFSGAHFRVFSTI